MELKPGPALRNTTIIYHRFIASADSYLTLGRRLTWLIPVDGGFSIEGTSSTNWIPGSKISSKSPKIHWTDDRLRCLWAGVTRLRDGGQIGHITPSCFIASDYSTATATTTTRSRRSPLPDHIRIQVDGHYALVIRRSLGLITGSGSDTARFLRADSGVRLALMNELGQPILLA